jgi:acyl carrier protein
MTDQILEAIAKYLDIPVTELTPERRLEEFEIDSLDLAEMVYDVEDRFDVRIARELSEARGELHSIGSVCRVIDELVRSKLAEKGASVEKT